MVKVTPNPPAADEPTSRAQSARNKKSTTLPRERWITT